MAVHSFVNFSQLQNSKRLDAQFYTPQLISIRELLRSSPELRLKAKRITDFGAYSQMNFVEYKEEGVRFLRNQDVGEVIINDNDPVFIDGPTYMKLTLKLQEGDVILPRVGTLGKSSVIIKDILPCSANQNLAQIKTKGDLSPYYLSVFLSTKYGLLQVFAFATGNVQPWLNLQQIGNIKIFVQSPIFQNIIEKLAIIAISKNKLSVQNYAQAEQILLSELGLQDWKPQHTLTYVRNYSQVTQARRMDSEHFQPKYDDLLSIINVNAEYCRQVSSFQVFNARGLQPIYSESGSMRVINSRHILKQHLDYDNFERTDPKYWDLQPEGRIFKHDILIYTTGANVGRTNIYLEDEKALASNHVNILRVRDENLIYVGFVLNSIVGHLQTRKLITGTAQAELYPADIGQFLVPFIDKDKQEQIASLLQQSYAEQREANALLEKAKCAVEIAVEEGEERAMEFIGRNTK